MVYAGQSTQVVQHDRADQPEHDPLPAAELERLQQRPGGQRERREVREQVQRRGAVARPHARNSSAPTHFVLCTPGSPGTMIRAG